MPSLTITLAALVVVLTFVDVRWGLMAAVFGIALSPEYQVPVVYFLRIEDGILLLVCFVWLGRVAIGRARFPTTPFNRPAKWYLFLTFASFVWGNLIGSISRRGVGFALLCGVKRLQYFLLFWIVAGTVENKRDVSRFLWCHALGAAASAWWGHWQYVTGQVARVTGVGEDEPNIWGMFMVFELLILLSLAFSRNPWRLRLIALSIALPCLVPLAHTFSRVTYASLMAGGATLVWAAYRGPLVPAVSWLLYEISKRRVGTGVLGVSTPLERLRTLKWSTFAAERLGSWSEAFRVIGKSPLLGYGVGTWSFAHFESQYPAELAHLGIPGFLVFLWLIRVAWGVCWRTYNAWRPRDPFLASLSLGIFAGVVAFTLGGFSGPQLLAIRTSEAFWFWMGIVCTLERVGKRGQEMLPGTVAKAAPEAARAPMWRPPQEVGLSERTP